MERSRRGVRSAGLLEDKLCGPQRSGTTAGRSTMVAPYHHAVSAAREWGASRRTTWPYTSGSTRQSRSSPTNATGP